MRRRRSSRGTVELDQGVNMVAMPRIVAAEEWQQERNDLLKAEKEATRELDALAARRRRLPMVRFDNYVFEGPNGPQTLLELFEGRDQLAIYQFMDKAQTSSARAAPTSRTTWRI